jgi:hypothetical protein
MTLSGIAQEYLVYSVYHAEGVHLKWALFGFRGNELRRRYVETFGKDKFLRAPALCGGLSILALAVSGLAMVFAPP